LELLLHDILENEADNPPPKEGYICQFPLSNYVEAHLPRVIQLLEYFPRDMLDVVVGCTRKTEVRLWRYLFRYAGRPKDLYEQCMERNMLKSAGGYLLVLHTLEHLASCLLPNKLPQIRPLSKASVNRAKTLM